MAFVPVPKDLSKVKTKVALNLTRRQLISFSLGGLVGFFIYSAAFHCQIAEIEIQQQEDDQ